MRILFINQYYPPDEAPTGLMLESVANALVEQGHEVTILCAHGGYAGGGKAAIPDATETAVRIVRIQASRFGRGNMIAKLADYSTFYLRVVWKLLTLSPKPDRIIALTTPPYLSLLARAASRLRGSDHAHWVMDLYPDVMVAHGMIRPDSIAGRLLARLTRWGMGGNRSKIVLTLGPDMEQRVRMHLQPETTSEWVPLWGTTQEEPSTETPESPGIPSAIPAAVDTRPESPLVLMYSGNMGLGHRFGEFLSAATTSGPGYEWRFNGDGRRRPEIETSIRQFPDAPIRLGPYIQRELLAQHLASADVHLVSLEPCWNGTMVPSKLPAIFSIGRPVIFVGSPECSIGQWILESGAGWVVPPDDDAAMQSALQEAALPSIRATKGKSARLFASRFFDRVTNSTKIARILAANDKQTLSSIG